MNFLLLCTGSPSKHLVQAIQKAGHTYEVHEPTDLYLFVSKSESGFDQIYNGGATLEEPVKLQAKSYHAVISRIGANLPHGASILRHLTENLGIYCAQTPDGLETASNKLKTTQRLSTRGLKVPQTVYAHDPRHINFLIKKVGGLPAVAKLLQGSQGKGVFLLETPLAANTALESFYKLSTNLKIQKMIKGGGKDIRAIVVGDQVAVAMERTANKGDFRANISQSGSGRKVELSEADKKICVEAAQAVDLRFAGVDIMKDESGATYVIEVNGNPGTKIIDITGHNYFISLIDFVAKRVQKIQGSSSVNSSSASAQQAGTVTAYNAYTQESRTMTAAEFSSLQHDGWTTQSYASSQKQSPLGENKIEVIDYYSGSIVLMTETEFREQERKGGHYKRKANY